MSSSSTYRLLSHFYRRCVISSQLLIVKLKTQSFVCVVCLLEMETHVDSDFVQKFELLSDDELQLQSAPAPVWFVL